MDNEIKRSTLYIVPTPIGNLGDASGRTKSILKGVDLIAAEDTRDTGKLLSLLGIDTDMLSYHKFNIAEKTGHICDLLAEGKAIALVSDAGTPCISDPGYELVRECRVRNINVIPLPGPCAAITALSASGFDGSGFIFLGFLDTKGRERNIKIQTMIRGESITVFYEAPHRVVRTLKDLSESGLDDREVFIAREMTKRYEEYIFTTVSGALEHFANVPPKGEFVIVIDRAQEISQPEQSPDTGIKFTSLEDIVSDLLSRGIHTKSIAKLISNEFGTSRNKVYSIAAKIKNEDDGI